MIQCRIYEIHVFQLRREALSSTSVITVLSSSSSSSYLKKQNELTLFYLLRPFGKQRLSHIQRARYQLFPYFLCTNLMTRIWSMKHLDPGLSSIFYRLNQSTSHLFHQQLLCMRCSDCRSRACYRRFSAKHRGFEQ